MALFSTHQRETRDVMFPLSRGSRRHTTDLRYMAQRESRLRRTIAVYEFAGVDHRERQMWAKVAQVRGWGEAAKVVASSRHRVPATEQVPTAETLDLREVMHDPGLTPSDGFGRA